MKKLKPYPSLICSDCGKKYGKYSVGCSSMHKNTCGVCGEIKQVTEPRDWGYPEFPGHEY